MLVLKKSYQKLWDKLSQANRNKQKYRNALCAVYASYIEQIRDGKTLTQKDQVIFEHLKELGFNDALKIQESEKI